MIKYKKPMSALSGKIELRTLTSTSRQVPKYISYKCNVLHCTSQVRSCYSTAEVRQLLWLPRAPVGCFILVVKFVILPYLRRPLWTARSALVVDAFRYGNPHSCLTVTGGHHLLLPPILCLQGIFCSGRWSRVTISEKVFGQSQDIFEPISQLLCSPTSVRSLFLVHSLVVVYIVIGVSG